MQELLALKLTVHDRALAEVVECAVAWAWRGEGPPPQVDLQEASRTVEEAAESKLTIETWPGTESGTVATLQFEHPDSADGDIWWRTAVDMVEHHTPRTIRVTLRLGREARGFRLAPAPYDLRPPGLVKALIEQGRCFDGEVPIPLPQDLSASAVRDFCERVVAAPTRALPVLMLAGSVRDAGVIARPLLGLAHVVVLGRLAWERLRDDHTDVTPPAWGGAVLLWPRPLPTGGFDRRYAPDQCRSLQELRGRAFQTLANLSVARVPRDPAVAAARAANLQQRLQQLEQDDPAGWHALAQDYADQLTQSTEHNGELTSEVIRLMEANESLESRLATADERLDYEARTHVSATADTVDLLDLRIDTWADFERHVHRVRSDALVIAEQVLDGLAACRYPDPQRMWEYLVRLSRVAVDYRSRDGDLGGRIKEYALDNHGIELSLKDSSLSRSLTIDGRKIDTVPHVKVDDHKKPSECGRIHFGIDGEGRRFVVDHVGLHL